MPHHDEIERRAYELYEARGRADGHDCDDWFQAERELRSADVAAEELVEAAETPSSARRRRRSEHVEPALAG